MRLWDYRLLEVLPNKMLVSQWRECIAIKRQWEKGTLKHRLVSYVMSDGKLGKFRFHNYVTHICVEMKKRDINFKSKYYKEIADFCWDGKDFYWKRFYPEHNDRYLKQCYYNLQEKYDRGIITKEEWEKIDNELSYLWYDD